MINSNFIMTLSSKQLKNNRVICKLIDFRIIDKNEDDESVFYIQIFGLDEKRNLQYHQYFD